MTANRHDRELDVRGLACPMPIVKARAEIGKIEVEQVLRVLSTDRGSVMDFRGWAETAKNVELLDQENETLDGAETYVHYVKRTA